MRTKFKTVDTVDDSKYDNDDLITFQLDSKKIDLYYSQLTKYSKYIRDKYLFSDVNNYFGQEIHRFQDASHISQENIVYFFQLLQQNYNIKENSNLTFVQCIDLLKISKYLEVRKLSLKINEYIKMHNIDVDFIIQMIGYEMKNRKETEEFQVEVNENMENLLSSKIDECFSNKKFAELPISIIYRIVKKSIDEGKSINDILFDFIIKSISKFRILFQFIDIQNLSKDRFSELCKMYCNSDEAKQQYFDYSKCNLAMIKEMNENQNTLQNKLDLISKKNEEQSNKMKELNSQITCLQKQFRCSEKLNKDQSNKMKELEEKICQLQSKLEDTEKENSNLQKMLKEELLIIGDVVASVKNGLIISARIKLVTKNSLDTTKSKYIISTCNAETIASESYNKGESITSTEMCTNDYICKPGKYFVRCMIYDKEGNSKELVSNEVTTSGESVTFNYEGKPNQISLLKGQYKFEVWGAKGGDSAGSSIGGLGGYSSGIVNLDENETVHIYVGGKGKSGNYSEGSETDGGFPDGGGTKTGYSCGFSAVPGTGGGSTSIRIGGNSIYRRVIVAGGGGGASGDYAWVNPGGFGGGLNGGNCYYIHELQDFGGGTQSGSTAGIGDQRDRHGDWGSFGGGATGKYKRGCDSGGGGGGGWYGGGSGGFGSSRCSSGGGGSGWVFTESSFKNWKSCDSTNAESFILDSKYYLTNAITVSGNEEFPCPDGNGKEKGHSGNGYAKITPV